MTPGLLHVTTDHLTITTIIAPQIVLTKADLLTPELLSACVLLLRKDLSDLIGREVSSAVPISAVCGSSGAGVTTLWKDLAKL